MGHVIARMVNGYTVGGRMYALIYSFHMPLFMMLSGYFISNKTLSKTVPDFLLTKARQLLLPAVTCTAICLLYLFLAMENIAVKHGESCIDYRHPQEVIEVLKDIPQNIRKYEDMAAEGQRQILMQHSRKVIANKLFNL